MPSNSEFQQAAKIIKNGGVISYPTESVFGLGCDPLSEQAVNRILQLKQRAVDKGLIIIAGNLEQLYPYIDISNKEKKKILEEKAAVTWLVRKSRLTPRWVSGQHSKVAIRISQNPTVTNLCNETNCPIISTSANPAGAEPAVTYQQCIDYFGTEVDLYLESSTELTGTPTQIRDIETGAIIR